MQRFEFQLANHKDNEPLLKIIERDVMGKAICLKFSRRPDFFSGIKATSYDHQVLIIRDKVSDSIVGCASRSLRKLFVNGTEKQVGYLSDLRLDPHYRNRLLLAKGYGYLRKLHNDGQAVFYLSTIVEDNHLAKRILTSQKAGLPIYEDLGPYSTYVFSLNKRHQIKLPANIKISHGSSDTLGEIIEFLNQEGRRKNLFPVLRETDFKSKSGFLRDFNPEDFLVLKADKRLAGVIGVWDQHNFKQVVVQSYGKWLKIARYPLKAIGVKLPNPGEDINYCSACFIVIKNNDRDIFNYLLKSAILRCRDGGFDHLMLGLHSSDSLNEVITGFKHISFRSRLYLVSWRQDNKEPIKFNNRPLYLDVSSL